MRRLPAYDVTVIISDPDDSQARSTAKVERVKRDDLVVRAVFGQAISEVVKQFEEFLK